MGFSFCSVLCIEPLSTRAANKKGVAQLDDARHGKEWLQRYPQRCEGLAALWPSFKSGLYVLSLHTDHCFQHGVHSGDGFRVSLEAALRGDHLHKFARHIHV